VPPLTPPQRRRLLAWLKAGVIAVVIVFVVRSFQGARQAFAEQEGFRWQSLSWGWLVMAGGCYFAGLLPMNGYWYLLLRALGQTPTWSRTFVAYNLGHLGKYVPGKALVVVIRTAMLRGSASSATLVAISVFIETLTMMTVGATVATILIAWQFSQQRLLLGLSILLMVLASIPTWPPLVRWAVQRLRATRWTPELRTALAGYTWRVMAIGWVCELTGWAWIGGSLWAVMQAMPLEPPLESFWESWPRLTAATSLSMVAGFLSLLPGGMGVRELVLDQLLKQRYGPMIAPLSAVALRLVWLITEVVLSVILYLGWGRRSAERYTVK